MKIIQKTIFLLTLLTMFSCFYDEPIADSGLSGPPEFVSFQNDLQPLWNANCNTTGCHDATPSHNPSLVQDNAYNALLNGGYVNTAIPNASILFTEVSSGNMPLSGQLTDAEIKQIYDWIRNGAPNN